MTVTMDDRSRRRVMLAASNLTTTTPREAAIIGGVAQSVLNKRPFDPVDAAIRARALLFRRHSCGDWHGDSASDREVLAETQEALNGQAVDDSPITSAEMRTAAERFMESYAKVRLE